MNNYLVCLDVALRKSGLIVLDPEGKIVYKNTLVIPKVDLTPSLVLLDGIYNKEFSEIRENFPGPFSFIIEDVLGYVHVQTALGIHASRVAAVLSWLHTHPSNEDIHYYTPNAVKYHFARKRGAKKAELLSALRIAHPEYSYDSLNEDEIDALALGLFHREKPPEKVKNVSKKKPVRNSK